MTRRSYSNNTKSEALEAILEGQAVSFVSDSFDVPINTLRGWMRNADIKINQHKPTPANADMIGALLIRVVAAELRALEAIAVQVEDVGWTKLQSADKLAAMYAIISDKNMQKIEAMSGTDEDS